MKTIIVELEVEGRDQADPAELAADDFHGLMQALRHRAQLEGAQFFERDGDEPMAPGVEAKKALSVVAHRCKRVAVTVRYEHRSETRDFSPANTVFRVLQWATGKKGFGLDDTASAKANLMLPGGTEPLPRDAVIGKVVSPGQCAVVFDLTLRDFTNG